MSTAEYQSSLRRYNANREVPSHVHGTVNGYTNYACRCEKCRAAQAKAARRGVPEMRAYIKQLESALIAAGLPLPSREVSS